MNLELDLKVKENPYLKFSRPPFEDNNIFNMFNYEIDSMDNFSLQSIEDFLTEIDFNDFVRYTTMGEVIKFNEQLEYTQQRYGGIFPDYEFKVTNSYNWKRGLYDALKAWYVSNAKFHKRNSGVNTFFNRIDNNRWAYSNFRQHFTKLDAQRMAAKKSVGKVVDNLEELIERNQEQIIKINEETEKANNFSPLYTVSNHIRCRNIDNEADYTKIKLITMIVAEAKTMSVIDNNNNMLYKLPVSKSYLYFERPFHESLNYNHSNMRNIYTYASAPGGRHPYIQTYGNHRIPYYQRHDVDFSQDSYLENMTNGTWSTLCLSNFNDDVKRALNKNDYLSFVHSISSWNGIYNKDYTSPYNSPAVCFYISGTPNDDNAENIRRLTGFSANDCFYDNLSRRQSVETDNFIRMYCHSRVDYNIALYGDDVIQDCNSKQCPFREQCTNYQKVTNMDDDFYFKIESMVGAIIEYKEMQGYNFPIRRIALKYYSEAFKCYKLNAIEEEREYSIFTKLENIEYWGKPKPLTAEERANIWIANNHYSSQSANQ